MRDTHRPPTRPNQQVREVIDEAFRRHRRMVRDASRRPPPPPLPLSDLPWGDIIPEAKSYLLTLAVSLGLNGALWLAAAVHAEATP